MQKKFFFLLMLSQLMLTGCFSSKSKEAAVAAPTSTTMVDNTEKNVPIVPDVPEVTTLSVRSGSSGGLAQTNNSLSGNFILSNVSVGGQ